MMHPISRDRYNRHFETIDLEDSSVSTSNYDWDVVSSIAPSAYSKGINKPVTKYAEIEMGNDDQEFHAVTNAGVLSIEAFRGQAKNIIQNERFQISIIGLILFNSIMMGVATFDFVRFNPSVMSAFEQIDMVMLVIFTFELGMNLFVYGSEFFKDNWFVFDFVSILLSWVFAGITIIRAFRVFRAFRLFARVGSLKRIISALMSTGEQMAAIVLVLALVFYIFAVMFTQLFGDCYKEGCYAEGEDGDLGIDYFGRLDYTMFTLFMLMSMENWSDIIRMTGKRYSWAWIPLLTFVVISAFVMLNLVIAVLCEALSALKEESDDEISFHKKNDNITVVTASANSDNERDSVASSIEALEKRLEQKDSTISDLSAKINDMQRALKGVAELQLYIARKITND